MKKNGVDGKLACWRELKICNQRFLFVLLIIFILLLNLSFISAQTHTLKVTEEHPFFLNGEWVAAKNLQVGDLLFTDDGKKAKITSIKEVDEDVEVYNLEAKPFNDFIVAGNVVAHNSNKNPLLNSIDDNFLNLNHPGKVARFQEIIGRTLDAVALKAIEDAHAIPFDPNAPIEQRLNSLRQKRRILLDSGKFSEQEIEFLIRSGTCGPDNIPPMDDYFYLLSKDSEQVAMNAARSISEFNRLFKKEGLRLHRLNKELAKCTPEELSRMFESGDFHNNPWILDGIIVRNINVDPFFEIFIDLRTGENLNGWFYLLILNDGRAFIHPSESVVLYMNPYTRRYFKKKKSWGIEQLCVKSFVRIYFEDGRAVNVMGDYTIENPGGLPDWKFQDFKKAAELRLDTFAQPEQGAP